MLRLDQKNTYRPSNRNGLQKSHYDDVIMGTIASLITSLTIVYSTVYSDADHRKHQSSASLAFVRRIHRGPVNSPHKWPVPRKMFPFDDVIMPMIRNISGRMNLRFHPLSIMKQPQISYLDLPNRLVMVNISIKRIPSCAEPGISRAN